MGRRPSCPKQERNGQPEQPHRNGRWDPWRRASLGESGQKFHPHHPGPEDQAIASAPLSSEAGLVRGMGEGSRTPPKASPAGEQLCIHLGPQMQSCPQTAPESALKSFITLGTQ